MSKEKYTRDSSVELLKNKHKALTDEGIERYPQRSDFTDDEVVAIKAFLGPWPRALEAAGLKPPRNDTTHQRSIEKRIQSKRRRTEVLKASIKNRTAEIKFPAKPEKNEPEN